MECAICLNVITRDKLTIEQCSHVFHSECLVKWKKYNENCPMCRTDLDVGPDLFCMQDMPDDEFEKLKAFFGM